MKASRNKYDDSSRLLTKKKDHLYTDKLEAANRSSKEKIWLVKIAPNESKPHSVNGPYKRIRNRITLPMSNESHSQGPDTQASKSARIFAPRRHKRVPSPRLAAEWSGELTTAASTDRRKAENLDRPRPTRRT